jgi:hypothetical protein
LETHKINKVELEPVVASLETSPILLEPIPLNPRERATFSVMRTRTNPLAEQISLAKLKLKIRVILMF